MRQGKKNYIKKTSLYNKTIHQNLKKTFFGLIFGPKFSTKNRQFSTKIGSFPPSFPPKIGHLGGKLG
jgi:hypothetical protein